MWRNNKERIEKSRVLCKRTWEKMRSGKAGQITGSEKSLMLARTSVDHEDQSHSHSRISQSQLPKTMPKYFLISARMRMRDSTTSLGNLYQCSVTLVIKNCFLMFRWSLLCFCSCPSPQVLSLDTTEKMSVFTAHHQILTCIDKLLWALFPPGWTTPDFLVPPPLSEAQLSLLYGPSLGPSLLCPACPCLACMSY